MTKKTRYLLILVGFIVFLILAPLIVLYVRGISFDFTGRKFVQTGLIAVRTEPKNVEVYLDGGLARKNAGDIKFLSPAEYDLVVKKQGYQDWRKMLQVTSGQVTWANPIANKIYLFYQNPETVDAAQGVSDFYTDGVSIFYLSGNSAVVSSVSQPQKNENFPLPKPANMIIPSQNGKLFALTNSLTANPALETLLVFNSDNKTFTDLSSLFSGQFTAKFSPDNELYVLNNNSLYRVDIEHIKKTPVLSQVRTFAFQENNIYYIRQNQNGLSLMVAQPPSNEGVELLKNLPDFKKAEIIINFEKQVFVLLDTNMYKVTSALEKIANDVEDFSFNQQDSTIIYIHSGELDFYNPFEHTTNFITRSSLPLSNPRLEYNLAHAFFFKDGKLVALELDTRDNQNENVLYEAKNPKKFFIDQNARQAVILDGDKLVLQKIR